MHARTPEDGSANRQSDSLAALAVTLFLIVAGLYLIQQLRLEANLQDCILSGKTACGT
jgi:hypothetical protein